jgi:phosphoserine phosphatase RsbU/P
MDSGPIRIATDEADERLRELEAISDLTLVRVGVEDLLHQMLERVRALLAVDTAAVLLLDASRGYLVTAATSGLEESEPRRTHIPLGQGFAGRVAAERRPVTVDAVGPDTVVNPALVRRGVRSMLGVPLEADGELLGVMHIGTVTAREFTEHDAHLLVRVAERVSSAARARLAAEDRAAAHALQRSLMPSRPPRIPGLGVAARYVPGEGRVSGDWYDVFVLPGDRVGVVMGDVAGHGLRASVVMGRLRSALRAYAIEHDDPAYVLHRLDVKIHHFEAGAMATALYGLTEPPFDRIRISSAGHLPPMRVTADQPAQLCDVPPDLPLGVDPMIPRRNTLVALPPGATIALFTDGLVERREVSASADAPDVDPIDQGLAELARVLRPGNAETACRDVMDQLLAVHAPEDDVALLLLARPPHPAADQDPSGPR